MANPDLMEAWYRFMAEAVRETSDAQAFFDKYAQGQPPAEWLAKWMKQSQTAGEPPSPDEMPDEWLEQWYKMMGVVPRSRYLKLLERHEKLRQDLDAARKKIEQMGGSFETKEQQAAAEEIMNLWKSTFDKTMQAQSEWMQSFSKASDKKSDASGHEEAEDDDAPRT
jgi:gas vesicle protein